MKQEGKRDKKSLKEHELPVVGGTTCERRSRGAISETLIAQKLDKPTAGIYTNLERKKELHKLKTEEEKEHTPKRTRVGRPKK